ncbi:DUF2442 domain-containing protein [Microbacterium sp. MYb66]|uniref:DUF2442 domain-containing protein n=1 Tax=Microbacterium sp. MYb66 TaxID=1848692 RepID=UPI0035BE46F9
MPRRPRSRPRSSSDSSSTTGPGGAHSALPGRGDWRLIGAGEGIRWPQVDEDIALAALLRGR